MNEKLTQIKLLINKGELETAINQLSQLIETNILLFYNFSYIEVVIFFTFMVGVHLLCFFSADVLGG